MSEELMAAVAGLLLTQLWLQLWRLGVVEGLQLVARQLQRVSWAAAAAGVQCLGAPVQQAEWRQYFEPQPGGTCLRLAAAAYQALHVAAEKLEWG